MKNLTKIFFLALISFLFFVSNTFASNLPGLKVPYTPQIPDGVWVNPWSNACEESTIIMIDEYYNGNREAHIPKATAKKLISPFFGYQNKLYGENYDANSDRVLKLINDYTSYTGIILENPSVEDIKNHLLLGFPVISFHYGFTLPNPNLHFLASGSGYHVMAITGYFEPEKSFITNDPGDTVTGHEKLYGYDKFLNTLGDFNHTTKKVDRDKPRVLLTYPKLIKGKTGNKVYYLKDSKKYLVFDGRLFTQQKWSYDDIVTVKDSVVEKFEQAGVLVYKQNEESLFYLEGDGEGYIHIMIQLLMNNLFKSERILLLT